MDQIDIYKRKTDVAWDQLCVRLEKDGLLTAARTDSPPFARGSMQVMIRAAAIAVLCISMITLYYVTLPKENTFPLLTAHNDEDATTLVTTLEDGSIVYLEENAALHYPEHFAQYRRQVSLEGNAQFDISGNRERPFCIETEEVRIEVPGTSFQVKNEKDIPFELAVTKGEVKVTAKGSRESCLVKTGEKVQLLPAGLLVSFMDNNNPAGEAYSHHIRFKDEKLGDILNVLNRRITDTPLFVDPSLADRSFTVAFASDASPDYIAEVICISLNLRSVRENGKIILTN